MCYTLTTYICSCTCFALCALKFSPLQRNADFCAQKSSLYSCILNNNRIRQSYLILQSWHYMAEGHHWKEMTCIVNHSHNPTVSQPHTPDVPVASLPSTPSLPLLELLHQGNDFGVGDKQSFGSLHGLA